MESERQDAALQTRNIREILPIVFESFAALNLPAILISFCNVIVRAFEELTLWLSMLILLIIGFYILSLIYRRDRIGYLYLFLVGFSAALAMRQFK